MNNSRALEDIIGVIEKGRDIALAGHTNPDGDAIGACFALALSLRKMGKRPLVLLEDYNEKFSVIPGDSLVYRGDAQALGTAERPVDTFIALDCASAQRLGGARALLEKTGETICIDHHVNTEIFARHNLLDERASSASELVVGLVERLVELDREIASALYAGIVFDTGGFRHGCTTPETHAVAAKLLSLGIPFSEIYNEIMTAHSFGEAKALGCAMRNFRVDAGYPIACLHVSRDEIKGVGADTSDLDGIVEYGMNTRGMRASVFAYEKEGGGVKVSLRSKGADMCGVARVFGGGGHRQAAAFTFAGAVSEAFAAVLPLVREALDGDG